LKAKRQDFDAQFTQGRSCEALAMREWMLVFTPLGATFYFLAYQDQFKELLAWLTVLVR
jgi:hypothetical protein